MSTKQKDAVFNAISNVLGENLEGPVNPTREERAQISEILMEGFKAGVISYEGQLPDDAKLRNYCSGVLSNWLRKDARLNGGVKYVAKNPGSRVKDASLIAMRTLQAEQTDPAEKAHIQTFIDRRLAELKPTKATKVVDFSSLPEALRNKYSSEENATS